MLFVAILILFALSATITSSLVYTPAAWRYAMATATACAVPLTWWTADWLQHLKMEGSPAAAWMIAALPFGVVVLRLWQRRRVTPRHLPGPDDDPVMRRYLAEKRRRMRKRRQEDELLERGE